MKRTVIWIKPTLCQLEQIGRRRRGGCSFALQPTVHLLYFMISRHSSLEAAQTVKSIGQCGGVWMSFNCIVGAIEIKSSVFLRLYCLLSDHKTPAVISLSLSSRPQANRHALQRNLTVGEPTSASRCHGDVMGRRIARTGRTRRTARLVSLFSRQFSN